MKLHIETTVNGEPAEFLCDAHETLLSALRNSLGLIGTKEGCATGDCGACSVLVDGRLVPACLVLAPEAQGRGIGGLLMVAALRAFREQGLATATLSVTADNPRAHRLYARLGFRVRREFAAHAWVRPPARIELPA